MPGTVDSHIAELSVQPSSAWNTPQWRHFMFSLVRYPTLIWHYLTWHLLAVAGLTRAVPSPIGLFSVVQFPNDACDTTDATPLTGTCLTSTECTGRSVLTSQGVIILYIVLQLQSFRLPPDRNSTIVANLAASSLLFLRLKPGPGSKHWNIFSIWNIFNV